LSEETTWSTLVEEKTVVAWGYAAACKHERPGAREGETEWRNRETAEWKPRLHRRERTDAGSEYFGI
jgi:hypothetical protein